MSAHEAIWIDRKRIQAAFSQEELALIDRALGAWLSDNNDAPESEVEKLRARLTNARV